MDEKPEPRGAAEGVAAVDRAFTILAALADQTDPSTLADLARRTGLYKSTILRILASVENAGYAARLHDGRYGLGPMAFRLGLAYEHQNPLRLLVLPILDGLVEAGTESASFHVRHGPDTRICLFRVNSRHSTLDRVEAGDILPLARGAAGRVIAAFSDETGTEQESVRLAGYALSFGERDPSCSGLAAPVFGASGALVGALSLSGPGERFTEEAVACMRSLILDAAHSLSGALGADRSRRAKPGS
uniref:IclR family transcriptional regulator n=1 Tax=Methylobacterium sp. B34 TaxID=95563 RepID=UPI000346D824|nr:IclR family transcriptional regulator [Methylobacterium sp. B34]